MSRHTLRPLLLASLVLAAMTVGFAQDAPGQPAAEPDPSQDDARALYAIGVSIGDQLTRLDVEESDLESLVKGIRDAALGNELEVDRNEFRELIPALQQRRQARMLERERQEAQAFLEQEAAKEGTEQFESGLIMAHLEKGDGASPAVTDEVTVHYRGTLRNGDEFDSSIGGDPVVFTLEQVIPCWQEALQKMSVGGKARIVCPAGIAYGDQGRMPIIKPGAALVFEVQLLGVTEKTPAAKAPAESPAPTETP